MEFNDYNKKAITDVYKNAHIALQSISDLIPEVEDEGIKNELQEEYEGYEDEDPEDFDLEMGFNPYMGCYDFDC